MDERIGDFELFIIGAGPGDPELITIKAHKVLQRASVILFDNLCNQDLLNMAPIECEKVYVGKQPYGCCTPQDQINALILEYAQTHRVVVRLKGGDPYIFGRGFEELLFAEAHGLKAEYIPGISSMQGAGISSIPLTHRGISESLWMITGTKSNGELSADLQLALQSSATVVIYMGMKKLTKIADIYIQGGAGDTPAAVIQHATLPHQRKVICKVRDLEEATRKANLSSPAIIIIGDVVNARELLAIRRNERAA